jgi:hypothetical protein
MITKGPWKYWPSSKEIGGKDGETICRMAPGMMTAFRTVTETETIENAEAIASLPDLIDEAVKLRAENQYLKDNLTEMERRVKILSERLEAACEALIQTVK